MGIVAKDSSIVSLNKVFLKDVKIPVALYIKKQEFGEPSLKINNPINKEDLKKSFISIDSDFFNGDLNIEGNLTSKKIKNLLYGNQFGVKTQR